MCVASQTPPASEPGLRAWTGAGWGGRGFQMHRPAPAPADPAWDMALARLKQSYGNEDALWATAGKGLGPSLGQRLTKGGR